MKILNQILTDISKNEDFVYVSIGANDGIFVDEIYHSGLLSANWKSYFIEPVKETFDKLIKNYDGLYPNNKFVYENSAIYIEDGDGELITEKNDDSNGLCSFFRVYSGDRIVRHQVKNITFKTFLQKHNILKIDFLKVDCEGMDAEIIVQCLENEIFPDVILFEDIEGSLSTFGKNNSIRNVNNLLNLSQSFDYIIINDVIEKQYESANKLLVKRKYINYTN